MVRNPTYAVLSRVTRAMRGGSQKVTNDDEGEEQVEDEQASFLTIVQSLS